VDYFFGVDLLHCQHHLSNYLFDFVLRNKYVFLLLFIDLSLQISIFLVFSDDAEIA